MHSIKLLATTFFIAMFFTLLPLMYSNAGAQDYQAELNDIITYQTDIDTNTTTFSDEDNIRASTTGTQNSLWETIIQLPRFATLFIKLFLNSFVVVPITMGANATTFIEGLATALLSLFVIVNNVTLIKTFMELVLKSGADR